jgi:hypothetical protein
VTNNNETELEYTIHELELDVNCIFEGLWGVMSAIQKMQESLTEIKEELERIKGRQ